MRINRHLRHTLSLSGIIDRLANDQSPPFKAWMLSSRRQISFNARQ
jgi:hypothetical protein